MAKARDYGWFTQSQAAEIFGVSSSNFVHTFRPLVPAAAIRQDGRNTFIKVRDLIDALVARERAKGASAEDELLAGGGDSPALEKYRAMRAGQEEIKLQRMRGQSVQVDEVKTGLQQIAGAVRRGIERVQRAYGNDAAEMVLEPLAEFERNWDTILGNTSPPIAPVAGVAAERDGVSEVDGAGVDAAEVAGVDAAAAAAADDAGVRGAGDRAPHGTVPGKPVQGESKPVRRAAARPDAKRKVAKKVRHRPKPKR